MTILPDWLNTLKQQPKLIVNDLSSGLMMAILVIPQSLGYASLAGLPPIMGLYASIVPTLVYAYIGSSSVSALGPVAVTAIMTSGALSHYASGSMQYIMLSIMLAFMVGVILCLSSMLRLGWIMQFVSRGVASGFVSAAAVMIIISQLKNLIGAPIAGDSLTIIINNLLHDGFYIHAETALLGLATLSLLFANRHLSFLWSWLPKSKAEFAKRLVIIIVVMIGIIFANQLHWQELGIHLLEPLPTQLPALSPPILSTDTVLKMIPSALLIALIAFISSSTVAGSYARIHQQPFNNNKELLGLGLANIASSFSGGFAVTGGISRTSLNISLGAKTPFASVICAIGILSILLFFGQYLTGLPYAILSAIIIMSAIQMVDLDTLKDAIKHDGADAWCWIISFITAIAFGLNFGLSAGMLTSFVLMVHRSQRVNIATIGQIGNSGHFRDITRHKATTVDNLLMLRIDESIYFGNATTIHNTLRERCFNHPKAQEIILVMTAVNHLDLTAQDMLLNFNQELKQQGRCLHLAEVKGPVLDSLKNGKLISKLSGKVFLSTKQAMDALNRQKNDWYGL
ncbi:SulP family inorganic anion transporter [Moraxella sp. Tifton1]|uniref:SulP family inorganic anion transporter n=1 Tax=Moraxella oculi TaxID=2940516 RepID=UPI0020137181|nr:SulP family inorganic anion transporter [Moraxella sp. Tifton1]MCL1624243.1 SulP family inorganic anion transporter [Moraxella sp. Tifton1]